MTMLGDRMPDNERVTTGFVTANIEHCSRAELGHPCWLDGRDSAP